MPNEFRYWRPPGNMFLNPPGIKILHDADTHYIQNPNDRFDTPEVAFPADFSAAVRSNLNYLYQSAVGRTMLDALAPHVMAPTIAPAVGGNSIQIISRAHMCLAANELHGGNSGPHTRAAIQRMNNNGPFINAAAELARAVNTTPCWSLETRPGHANVLAMSYMGIVRGGHVTSYAQTVRDRLYQYAKGWDSNEGYAENRLYVGTQHGQHTGSMISTSQMQAWLIGGPLPGPLLANADKRHHLLNVVSAKIYDHDTVGPGTGCSIGWRHQANYEMNQRRPPAIGLAHELIHAYHALRGDNPGVHDADPSVVLFEYRCVGLGPFANAAITENALRAQWPGILAHIPVQDAQNRKVPGQRVSYM